MSKSPLIYKPMEVNGSIRVPALGRDVKVGDLYNYYKGTIWQSNVPVLNDDYKFQHLKQNPGLDVEQAVSCINLDRFICSMVGIESSHLKRCIEQQNLNVNQLWFADFFNLKKVSENEIQVAVFFRVVRSVETIRKEFLNTKMLENRLISDGRATHLVKQIVLGAEMIFILQRDVNLSQETKADAEQSIYKAASSFFYQVTELNLTSTKSPIELENVSCMIYSSLEPGRKMKTSFQKSCELLKDIVSEKSQNSNKWRPVYIDLEIIPFQTEYRILLDQNNDKKSEIEQHWYNIMQESRRLIHFASNGRIPPLETTLRRFQDLLTSLWDERILKILESGDPEHVYLNVNGILYLLSKISGWLQQRHEEIERINSTLKLNQRAIFEFLKTEPRLPSKMENNNPVIVWSFNFVADPLVEEIQEIVGHASPAFKLPVFQMLPPDKTEIYKQENQHQNSPLTNQDSQYEVIIINESSSSNVEMLDESFLNRRSAEVFVEETSQYCELIKQGHPNVYQLKAVEHSIGDGLCWFDVGNPQAVTDPLDNHKVILLMGATGCGKSTLINGMINYILGVQWKDPFRFKIIRENHSGRNQAHSQTNSVTAYNLHYHTGMAIPYSITIIDTPGYGDTRGVERDKEITRTIHRFLTQPESQIDRIHAVCFVAASGDSRLTVTQRYILDSVLSTFGKDIKENIRLLVTFADNADPPVVEACKTAHFPMTSAGITYSKFNSSVLYASNQQQGEDDVSFDELFWDMGQENFQKFFEMLEGMDGRDLKSTQEVIQRRQRLEQSLKDIELELDICLENIENMEKFQREIREHGYKIDSNKDFFVDVKEMRSMQMNCKKGLKAYNCRRCSKTCGKPIPIFGKPQVVGECQSCSCPEVEHEYQEFQWQAKVVPVRKILQEKKTEFQMSSKKKSKIEDLLENCSEELNMAKAKVFSLLDQVGENSRLLDSTALRSNVLNPAEYLSLMRSRVHEKQAPGYMIRMETIRELEQCLIADSTNPQKTIKSNSGPSSQTGMSCSSSGLSRPHWQPTNNNPGFGRGFHGPIHYSNVGSPATGHMGATGHRGHHHVQHSTCPAMSNGSGNQVVKETGKRSGFWGIFGL